MSRPIPSLKRITFNIRQTFGSRPESTGFGCFNYKSFYRVLVQLGEILRLRNSRHMIQGEPEAEFLQLLQKKKELIGEI